MRDKLSRIPAAIGVLFRKYLVAGIIAVIPIWVTWLLIEFLFRTLSSSGQPLIENVAENWVRPWSTSFAAWLEKPLVPEVLAALVMIVGLALVGWLTTRVAGQRLMAYFDALVERIPVVKMVYGGVKQLIASLQARPDGVQRVVLIDFPSPEMKTVGLVTRTFEDADTGRKLAAVYVPTTPNPTSGYLEIVPIERITSTSWTVDEAMNFIISGGTVAPKRMHFDHGIPAEVDAPNPEEPPESPAEETDRVF
ncbi:MAG: DUF502 domain-containing protein [Armatimonadia bacterium]|nr:DUF502 domain-containing protein [Armatimonadia bacterium]